MTSGDHVFEEEGQVHQSDVEAHRYLCSHGPATTPRQLCGTSWSPARGPTCECQGLCVNVFEHHLILHGKVYQARPPGSGSTRCLAPSSSLSPSAPPVSFYTFVLLQPIQKQRAEAPSPQHMASCSLLPFPLPRYPQSLEPMLNEGCEESTGWLVRQGCISLPRGWVLLCCWERHCSPWGEQDAQPRGSLVPHFKVKQSKQFVFSL